MMKDDGSSILMGVLFAIGGLTILIFTWGQTMPVSERIVDTSIGLIGILWGVLRVPLFASRAAK